MAWVFDGHVLDLDRRELRCGARLVALQPQVFDLLSYLVEHRGRIVGKDELFQAIWRGRAVSDAALTTRINAVRRSIGDDGRAQRLIRTYTRKGVRFVGEVSETAALAPAAPVRPASAEMMRTTRWSAAAPPAIAVLPFAVLSEDREARWFADGLAEDLVTALTRYRWLPVLDVPRCFAGTDATPDPSRVGRERGARYVIQGAVRRGGPRLRVTARLIDADAGSHLWSDRFDGLLADGLELQDAIAATIAGSVEPAVQAAETRRCSAFPAHDATPYELHSRAQPIFSSGRGNVIRSLGLLEQATALDPDYWPALADIANCRQVLDINGWTADRPANRGAAIDAARRVLHAAGDPEPVATAAFALAYFGEDLEIALALIDNCLRLNPSFARGWYMNGMARLYAGDPEQAIDSFETSIRLNPRDRLGRRNNAGIGIARFFTRRFDEAVPRLRLVVEEFPRWTTPFYALASCHAHLGFPRDAEATAGRIRVSDRSSLPSTVQFRNRAHRRLLMPGLKLAGVSSPAAGGRRI